MSTHCLIGYAFGDKVYFAYCQTDGYPEHMVPILRTIHDGDFLAKKIINAGEFRHLYEDCKVEPYEDAKQHACSLEEFINDEAGMFSDYRYLYQNCRWKCFGFGPENFDEEDWKELKRDYAELLDLDNRNKDGSYNFYEAPMTDQRQFLVQRICNWDEDSRDNTIMTSSELIHYIDMQDICSENYKIYEITEFGMPIEIFYRGWQPGCLIEFADSKGQIILSGYGTDH